MPDLHIAPPGSAPGWTVVMPVKMLTRAKSRLQVPAPESWAFAFLQDALSAVLDCPSVAQAVVVTGDPAVATYARDAGCLVVDEQAAEGINSAARLGAAARSTKGPVAVMVSDLPCLTASALASVLDAARLHPTSVLADAEGGGSTMWCTLRGDSVDPAFGIASRSRHRELGAVDLVTTHPDRRAEWMPARMDVDTESALESALSWGVGPATRAALALSAPDGAALG